MINIVRGKGQDGIPKGTLIEVPPPTGRAHLPKKARNFKGVDVDYSSEQKRRSIIGFAGEGRVIELEKKGLIGTPYAEKVKKMQDGEGYDIRSFTRDGVEKYIEVKTTEGGENTPFFLTVNEWDFMQQNPDRYVIYRLFDFSMKMGSGRYFVLNNPASRILKEPIAFKCYVKQESS